MGRRIEARRTDLRTEGSLALAVAVGCSLIGCGAPPAAPDAAVRLDATVDAAPACREDTECEDGLACNGEARCEGGRCVSGAPLRCDDTVACTADFCSEELRRCVNRPLDADGDGHADSSCVDARGMALGDDCDDALAAIHPGAPELCDAMGLDEDCDPETLGGRDGDGDGFTDAACCNGAACGTDCNDALRGASPDATEVCNLIDDDCDGLVDEGVLITVYRDLDGDRRGDATMSAFACAVTPGYAVDGDDCDDTSALRSPALFEACDGIDNDCDGTPDPADVPEVVSWYEDRDGDGFGDPSREVLSCSRPMGVYSLLGTDCDDTTSARHPAQAERCNGVDDDCNGAADFVITPGDLEDDDGDGRADARCTPRPASPDCDDRDAATGGDAPEICDGRDNDCDGTLDEGVEASAFFRDADADGWGSEAGGVVVGCGSVPGYIERAGDCDDGDPLRYPGVDESCNGSDEDCDGFVDEDPEGALCTAIGDETVVCRAGRCRVIATCEPGTGDCDGLVGNGCEIDLTLDIAHCGGCGRGCPAREPGTVPICVAGGCGIACDELHRDCNGTLIDGCEVTIGTDTNCASCGDACLPTETCDALRTCVPRGGGCMAPLADCDANGSCETDTSSSITSCGGCLNRCEGDNALWICLVGSCATTGCLPGFLDCDAMSSNGCEIDGRSDVDHCGACPNDCDARPFTTAGCTGGVCSAPACLAGRYDCDGDLTMPPLGNGCESAAPCPLVTWATTWGDVDDDSPLGMGAVIDVATDSGDVYVLTSFSMSLEVSATPYAAPGDAAMVIALTSTGGFRWATLITPDPIGSLKPERIAVTPGGVVVVGSAAGGGNLRVGASIVGSLGPGATGFVVRLSSTTGAAAWTRLFPGGVDVMGLGIGTSEVVIGGAFSNLGTNFGSGFVLTPALGVDGFVVRLDAATGVTNLAFALGSSANEAITSVAVRPSDGDIFVGGFYEGAGAAVGGYSLPIGGMRDGFVARCSSGGGVGGAIGIATASFEEVTDVRVGGPYWYFSGIYSGSTNVAGTSLTGASTGSFLGAVDYVTYGVPWVDGFTGGGDAPFGIRRFAVDAMDRIRVAFPANTTGASRFGGVPFGLLGDATHLVHLRGSTGAVTRIDGLDDGVAVLRGVAIATMPDGGNVIAGSFSGSTGIAGVPVTSAGSWDQLVLRTAVLP